MLSQDSLFHDLASNTTSLITYFRASKRINVKIKASVALSSQNRSMPDCASIAYIKILMTSWLKDLRTQTDQKPESGLGLSSGWAQGLALPVQTGLAASAVVGPSFRTWLHTTLQSEYLQKNHSHCQHRPYVISCILYPSIWYWRLRYPLWINLRLSLRETINYPEKRWVLRCEVHNELRGHVLIWFNAIFGANSRAKGEIYICNGALLVYIYAPPPLGK